MLRDITERPLSRSSFPPHKLLIFVHLLHMSPSLPICVLVIFQRVSSTSPTNTPCPPLSITMIKVAHLLLNLMLYSLYPLYIV